MVDPAREPEKKSTRLSSGRNIVDLPFLRPLCKEKGRKERPVDSKIGQDDTPLPGLVPGLREDRKTGGSVVPEMKKHNRSNPLGSFCIYLACRLPDGMLSEVHRRSKIRNTRCVSVRGVKGLVMSNPFFQEYIGVDYSGAKTPESSLKGLRVYRASREVSPVEVMPPPGPRTYWSRRGLAAWLLARLSEEASTLVGIDHGFSFPLRYFERHLLEPDWSAFLDDYHQHWPTDTQGTSVDCIRYGWLGQGAARSGSARWRRMTEERVGAKSVFHFDVPGSVAKSTHAGLPWLRSLRRVLGGRVHFWPFDGWEIPAGRSVPAEIYPSLWSKGMPREVERTQDQHDAWVAAARLRQADLDGELAGFFRPSLSPAGDHAGQVEGWILGVT